MGPGVVVLGTVRQGKGRTAQGESYPKGNQEGGHGPREAGTGSTDSLVSEGGGLERTSKPSRWQQLAAGP